MRLTVYFPEDSPTIHESVGNRFTVGRLGDNDVRIDDPSVSSRHAEIAMQDGRAVLRDLGSTNGTYLNGEQVSAEATLNAGDEIAFGNVRTVFGEPVAAAPEPTEAEPALETPGGSGRPDNFHYMSPLPRPQQPKDRLAVAAWAAAGLGVLAAAYALVVILGM